MLRSLDEPEFGFRGGMFEQRRHHAVDQRAQQAGGLQPGDLLLLESMLHIGLDAGEMAAERADRRVARNGSAFLGDAGERIREQGRRGFRGTWQGNGS